MPKLNDVPPRCGLCPYAGRGVFFDDIEIPSCFHPLGFKAGEPLCIMPSDPPPEQCPLVKVQVATAKKSRLRRWWEWRKVTSHKSCGVKQEPAGKP